MRGQMRMKTLFKKRQEKKVENGNIRGKINTRNFS